MARISAEVIQHALENPMEHCVLCFQALDFPKTVSVEDWHRWSHGRQYVEGCGQVCGSCNRSVAKFA